MSDLDAVRTGWLEGFGQDLRHALRGLMRAPVFTIVAVFSLAVGIAVNAGLSTYIHATLLEPVPGVTGADRVVKLLLGHGGREQQEWSYPDFADVRTAGTPLSEVVGWKTREVSLTAGDRKRAGRSPRSCRSAPRRGTKRRHGPQRGANRSS
jgi:hypothetical protein